MIGPSPHSRCQTFSEVRGVFSSLLPSNIHVKAVTYGTPRVGNPEFAALLDSKVCCHLSSFAAPVAHRGTRAKVLDFVRINNEADLVPIVPGRFLGFQHPHGEIHIVSPGNAVACSGDDNADDSKCTIKTVPNILGGDIINHLGPYEGIFIGTIFCN